MHKLGSDNSKLIFNGIATGFISTFVFNPLDRALFLMVKENKPILTASLWKHPYQGVTSAIYSRAISYGIFFSLSDIYKNYFKDKTSHSTLYGSLATALTTVILCQPMNVVKMYKWNHNVPGTLFSSGKQLVNHFGGGVIFKGIIPTYIRDGIFASTYIVLSEKINPEKKFTTNIAIGSLATLLSSPANYYRNRQFFNFEDKHIPFQQVVSELRDEVNAKKSFISKVNYVAHKRMNIGWGTLRVGIGMAVSNKIYDWLKQQTLAS